MDIIQKLTDNLKASICAKNQLLAHPRTLSIFEDAITHTVQCYRAGGRLYIAGNGGSAADAQHLAAELVVRLSRDRNPLPAEALTTDSSILTAIGNDYGYEHIFSRQLAAKIQAQDVFLGITSSGKSPNIIQALTQCRHSKIKSILFAGKDGGSAAELADYCILAPGIRTSTIQELHIVLAHTLCECVEAALFPD